MMQKRVYFNSRDKLIRLDIQKIVYFEGDGNYTYIITANRQKVCLTINLSHAEEALATQLGESAKRFMRVGKRFIVNMNYTFFDFLSSSFVPKISTDITASTTSNI